MLFRRILLLTSFFLASSCTGIDTSPQADTTFVVFAEDTQTQTRRATNDSKLSGKAYGNDQVMHEVAYSLKEVHWPTGTVKVLRFAADDGGVLHSITDETTIYVLEGRVQASVNGEDAVLEVGDVASLPVGLLRNPEEGPTDARVVAWTTPSLVEGASPSVVRSAEVDTRVILEGLLGVRRYNFPGNSVRVASLSKGLKTSPGTAPTDSLIFVTKGSMEFFQGGKKHVVGEGDFIREVAGVTHHWNVTSDSAFVTTSGLPVGAAPIDPRDATDNPE